MKSVPSRVTWSAISAILRPPKGRRRVATNAKLNGAVGDIGVRRRHTLQDPELLSARLKGLHIDLDTLLGSDQGVVVSKLKSVCGKCAGHNSCRTDLAEQSGDPSWQVWREYCPNATTLSALVAVQGRNEIERIKKENANDSARHRHKIQPIITTQLWQEGSSDFLVTVLRAALGKLARGTILFILMVMFATWMWSFGARDAPEPPKHRVILHWYI